MQFISLISLYANFFTVIEDNHKSWLEQKSLRPLKLTVAINFASQMTIELHIRTCLLVSYKPVAILNEPWAGSFHLLHSCNAECINKRRQCLFLQLPGGCLECPKLYHICDCDSEVTTASSAKASNIKRYFYPFPHLQLQKEIAIDQLK